MIAKFGNNCSTDYALLPCRLRSDDFSAERSVKTPTQSTALYRTSVWCAHLPKLVYQRHKMRPSRGRNAILPWLGFVSFGDGYRPESSRLSAESGLIEKGDSRRCYSAGHTPTGYKKPPLAPVVLHNLAVLGDEHH
jgi:hypothetical protein